MQNTRTHIRTHTHTRALLRFFCCLPLGSSSRNGDEDEDGVGAGEQHPESRLQAARRLARLPQTTGRRRRRRRRRVKACVLLLQLLRVCVCVCVFA